MITLQYIHNLLLCWALIATAVSACRLQVTNINVPDYTPVGTILLPVLVLAPDTPDVTFTNSDSNNVGQPLQVLANNSLMLKEPITRTTAFRVSCSDATSATLFVIMIDTDNNAPVWESWNYTESVKETQPVPYVVTLRPKATDEPDAVSGQELQYRILPSEYSSYFSLHNPFQSIMNISLVKQLDYETVQHVILTLQVLDYNSTGHLVFTVNTTLTVNIINEDDENPVWLNCTAGAPPGVCYVRPLFSNSTIGTLIDPPLKAIDGDLEFNASIVYSIVLQSPENLLTINTSTGSLSLANNLPVPGAYSIVLFATQANNVNRKTNTEMRLNIVSPFYSPPVFDQPVYNVTVMENNPPGSTVVVVKAVDHLRKGVTYALQNFLNVFTMNADSGELKANGSLDYEFISSYSINVTATDGTGFGFANVFVHVGNENEFNTTFDRTEYTFAAAKRENGLEVGRVNATDGDRTPVSYSIMDPDISKLFSVDSTLGIVRISTAPANLISQQYRFSVTASDGSRTSVAIIVVNFDYALTTTYSPRPTTNSPTHPTHPCLEVFETSSVYNVKGSVTTIFLCFVFAALIIVQFNRSI